MAKRKSKGNRAGKDRPLEIPMTDLGWTEEGEPDSNPAAGEDIHAAGTPGGGTAAGGLAGTNVNEGSPNNADLEDALGSGVHDTAGEDEGGPPYSGKAGGAVGGTPAQKRAKGGESEDHFAPDPDRGDTTIGAPPPRRRRKRT
jgi:hypothetical protein